MKTIHIERVYLYGDNIDYHIELPDEFKLYEFDFLSDKQKHYASVEPYDKKIYKKFRNLLGTDAYRMGDHMLILFWNEPVGMYVHTREFVSDNIAEFNEKLSNVIKPYVLAKYTKRKIDGDLVDKLFDTNTSNKERAECIERIEQIKNSGDILTSVSKVLGVNGDYLKIASIYEYDILGEPLNHASVDLVTLYDFFSGVSTTYSDNYGKLVNDMNIFEKARSRFDKILNGESL
jgi:hypothetical protein